MDIEKLSYDERLSIWRASRIELAQQDFWWYCHLRIPAFYKHDRIFLKELCCVMQAFYENRIRRNPDTDQWEVLPREEFFDINNDPIENKYSDWEICDLLILNLPPRHGKSLTAQLLSEWCFGRDNSNKIITISYNETLSGRFSKGVRNGISSETKVETHFVFNDVFPDEKIHKGDAAAQLWSLDGQHFSYLGGSPKGTLTGAGCNIGIIDDIIKNKYEACNQRILDEHYEFYTDTYLSRLEEGNKQLMIMTRWSSQDLCGKVIQADPRRCFVYTRKAIINESTGEMLCEGILSKKSLDGKKALGMSEQIILANYQQQPIDAEGRLYKHFATYEDIPKDEKGNSLLEMIVCRTDTADKGDDFLCSIVFGVYKHYSYVLDVYYTKEGMEITEKKQADMIVRNNVRHAVTESNNGGEGWSRNVERLVREVHRRNNVRFDTFHESRNKQSRILANSYTVQTNVLFPTNWYDRWPEYFEAMNTYQKEGKNINDDGPDCTSGIVEYHEDGLGGRNSFNKLSAFVNA